MSRSEPFDPTVFGIEPADEAPHAHDPSEAWWNESWFWDWYDADGARAGHCRIGTYPAQDRLWFWLFVFERGEWIAVEQPRLDLTHLRRPELAYDRYGLAFSWEVHEPLRQGRLRAASFGRVLSGGRAGLVLPVEVDLDVEALGPAHSLGRATGAGHESVSYDASRFEQPIRVRGRQGIDGHLALLEGRGERDHSWGPRNWDIEWTFLVANAPDTHLQCVIARLPGVGTFPVGYLAQGGTMASLSAVDFDIDYEDAGLDRPMAGRFRVRDESGRSFGGRIEVVSAHEIDLAHTLTPPRRSVYRRSLIRIHQDQEQDQGQDQGKDAGHDGAQDVLGWLEDNHFLAGDPALGR